MKDETAQVDVPQGSWAKYRPAILTGIISSLLVVYFVDPIFSFLGRLAIRASKSASGSYLDRLYSEVATAEPNFGFIALMAIAGLMLGMGISAIRGTIKPWPRESKEPASPRRRVLRVAFWLLVSLFPTLVAVDSYIRLKTVSTFNQRLDVISPEITELERKRFISDFASMRGKSDFDLIMSKMETIAVSKGISLPENLLYPL